MKWTNSLKSQLIKTNTRKKNQNSLINIKGREFIVKKKKEKKTSYTVKESTGPDAISGEF